MNVLPNLFRFLKSCNLQMKCKIPIPLRTKEELLTVNRFIFKQNLKKYVKLRREGVQMIVNT